MPLAANDSLDDLYLRQRLLNDEAARLDAAGEQLGDDPEWASRRYILDVETRALREEATRLNAAISDILERDLQR